MLSDAVRRLHDQARRRAELLHGAALGAAAAALIAVNFLPLWGLTLWSIQFPKGLRLVVYPTTIVGNISDINVLNHYIGMAPITHDSFPELKVLPLFFGVAAALCLVAAVARRLWATALPLVALGVTAIYGFWSMRTRLYQFGHDLDPSAAISMDPFTPPIFGEFRIAQFSTYSYFSLGTTLAVAAGVLVVFSVYLAQVRRR